MKRTITDISSVTGVAALTVVMLSAGCGTEPADVPPADTTPPITPTAALVDDERIRNAAVNEPGSWLAYGQTFEEQRFSGLTQINRETVTDLGLAWTKPLGERHRVETTPLVVDGVMYISDPWNVTYALDAATGEEIWVFDPETDREIVRYSCCGGPMTRGVAVYQGRVYIATFDGRMVAVDAATGQKVWDVSTQHPSSVSPFTVTGAPRAGGGKVYIGQSSSEFGVRGYVSAYDAETGDLAWRFYLVPGDPSLPFEHPELEMAAETWGGEWWTLGGGGTVWSSIVYDPDLHTVYLGVGNGAPWPRDIRSPGRGDNLFLTCVVAVDPDTGRMKWYYQQVPGDNWDYSAAMQMTLADMEIDGTMRKVLLQAPKNGFFYVLGREDGELLRAHPYGRITWATHVDMETGRPVENTDVYYEENPQWIFPGAGGSHNWQPMSFDADQGVMYIPTHDSPTFFGLEEEFAKTGIFKMREVGMTTGLPIGAYRDQLVAAAAPEPETKAYLKKFDPLSGETLWAIENEGTRPSGVLATAGGLIFQSDGMAGYISAYNTDNGETLWRTEVPGARFGPGPISYEIDGTQYIAITSGVDLDYEGEGKLFVFKLGGDMAMPPALALLDTTIPEQPPLTGSADDLARGDQLYHAVCANCHGALGQELQAGTRVADLRRMSPETHENYMTIVLGGSLEDLGMRSFANELNEEDVEAIRQFVISRALLAQDEEMSQ